MAYISSERVAEIRKELKATFPNYKFSVTNDNHSGVNIAILEAPIMLTDRTYEQVNVYYVRDIKDTEKRTVIEIIVGIANKGVKYYETGDYGTQPSHYTHITIGQWDKPFKMALYNEKGKTVGFVKVKKSLAVSETY